MNFFNCRLVEEALILLREKCQEGDPFEAHFKIKRIDEQLDWLKTPEYELTMAKKGGAHLGEIRNWIQRKAINGDRVTWGSDEVLQMGPMSSRRLESLANRIAAATYNEVKGLR